MPPIVVSSIWASLHIPSISSDLFWCFIEWDCLSHLTLLLENTLTIGNESQCLKWVKLDPPPMVHLHSSLCDDVCECTLWSGSTSILWVWTTPSLCVLYNITISPPNWHVVPWGIWECLHFPQEWLTRHLALHSLHLHLRRTESSPMPCTSHNVHHQYPTI